MLEHELKAGDPGNLKIALIGAGAVGAYYGGILSHAGENVHFLLRSDYDTVSKNGLKLIRHGRDEFVLTPPVHDKAADIGEADMVIVAAKTTANPDLPALIDPLMGAHTVLLTLQNGMGNCEFFAQRYGAERIMAGLCFVCINRTAPGVIENYMPGYVMFGEFVGTAKPRTRDIAARFIRAGSPASITDTLEEALWRKLFWNVPFNGLTIAAGGIPTGELLKNPELERLARDIMKELQDIAAAYGHAISDAFIQKQFDATYPMGDYKPSSLLDYLEGKPVEVDAIWGEPLRRSHAAGIPAPRLHTLHALLTQLCKGKG